jgi:hypothetical protein
MKNNLPFFLFGLISLFFTSCTTTSIYAPVQEMPHSLSEKGELQTSLFLSHYKLPRFQGSLGYSPIKNIGISYNRFFGSIQNGNSIALGLYSNKKIKNNNKTSFYDIYGGFSENKNVSYRFDFLTRFGDNKILVSYNKYFIQAGQHLLYQSFYFDNYASFTNVAFKSITSFDRDPSINEKIEILRENNIFYNLEFTNRAGFKNENYNLFVGTSYRLGLSDEPISYDFITFFMGVNVPIFK